MSQRLSTLAAAVAATFTFASAQAATLIIDNFNLPIPGVVIADNDGVTGNQLVAVGESLPGANDGSRADIATTAGVGAYATQRVLTHTLLTAGAYGSNDFGNLSSAGTGALPNFAANQLNMSNGSDTDSVVSSTWTLSNILTGGGPTAFLLDIIATDPGVTGSQNVVEAFLDNVSLGFINVASPGTISWILSASQAASLADGSLFSITFNGANAWDMGVDNLRLEIPEPASLALVGLALVGAGIASRRRRG